MGIKHDTIAYPGNGGGDRPQKGLDCLDRLFWDTQVVVGLGESAVKILGKVRYVNKLLPNITHIQSSRNSIA